MINAEVTILAFVKIPMKTVFKEESVHKAEEEGLSPNHRRHDWRERGKLSLM